VKTCTKCRKELDSCYFYSDNRRSDGLQSQCKDCMNLAAKKRYESMPEDAKALLFQKRKEYEKTEAVKKKKREQAREYYATHTKIHKERCSDWNTRNRDRVNTRYRERSKDDVLYSLMKRLATRMRHCVTKGGRATFSLLGCSPQELIAHLGKKPGRDYHVDHICPLAQAENEEELLKLFHYTNLQWLQGKENIRKRHLRTVKGEYMCKLLLGREWRE
jgi:hypothetical protein